MTSSHQRVPERARRHAEKTLRRSTPRPFPGARSSPRWFCSHRPRFGEGCLPDSESFKEILPSTSVMQALFCNNPTDPSAPHRAPNWRYHIVLQHQASPNPFHTPGKNRTQSPPKSCFQRELSGNAKTEEPSERGNLLSRRGCCTASPALR